MKRRFTTGIVICCVALSSLFTGCHLRKKNTLTIGIFTGSYWGVPEQDSFIVLDKAISQFEQKYDIQVTYQTGITLSQYEEWLGQEYMENDMPDVFFVPSELFSTYVSNGMLLNLDEWIAKDESIQRDMYYDVSLDATTYDGRIYALPYASSPYLMLVNQDLLSQYNLDMPDMNWTWDDMLSYYRNFQAQSGDALFINGYTWEIAAYNNSQFFYNEQKSTVDFASDDMISAVSYLRKLNVDHDSRLSTNVFENENILFQPVSYSAYKTYTSYPYRLQYSSTQWAGVSLPLRQENLQATPVETLSIGIYQNTNRKDLAWLFLSYLSTDYEIQKELMMNSPCVSVLPAVVFDEELQTIFSEDEQKINLANVDLIMQSGQAAPRSQKYLRVVEMADSSMNTIVNNEQDIENSLIILNQSINEFLRQYYQ